MVNSLRVLEFSKSLWNLARVLSFSDAMGRGGSCSLFMLGLKAYGLDVGFFKCTILKHEDKCMKINENK